MVEINPNISVIIVNTNGMNALIKKNNQTRKNVYPVYKKYI